MPKFTPITEEITDLLTIFLYQFLSALVRALSRIILHREDFMSAHAQPHSLKQATSAIGSEIFASFERDIEDAIFETIVDEKMHRSTKQETYHERKPSFGKLNRNESADDMDLQSRLQIFSKRSSRQERKPFASQIVLSLAVCAFTIAIVLPIVWMLNSSENVDQIAKGIKNLSPDASIATGSIVPDANIPQIIEQDALGSTNLNKPNVISHDKGSSLYAVGQGSVVKGSDDSSVIYFSSQD